MSSYITVAASQTGAPLAPTGQAGGKGDFLKRLVCTVSAADATSVVSLLDGEVSIPVIVSTTPIGVYAIEVGAPSQNGAWTITTGAGATVIAVGDFVK